MDFFQALSNEKYVSILNHCFDDIERFIQRLQHTAAAIRELQMRNQKRGGKNGKLYLYHDNFSNSKSFVNPQGKELLMEEMVYFQ